jgi:hypothetical protein
MLEVKRLTKNIKRLLNKVINLEIDKKLTLYANGVMKRLVNLSEINNSHQI